MKVTASIKKPTIKHYTVKGKDLDALFDALNAREYWGRFIPNEVVNIGSKDPVDAIKVTAKPVIMMPKWADYSKADKDSKDAFDAMYKKLLKHEKNHWAILLERVAMLSMELEKVETLSAADGKKLKKTFKTGHEKAQKKYDDKTDHGVKEGVAL